VKEMKTEAYIKKIIEETGKKPSPITPPKFVSKIKKDVEN